MEVTLEGKTFVRNEYGVWAGPFPYLSDELESALDEIVRLRVDAVRKQDALNHLLNAVSAKAAPDLMDAAIREARAAL